MADVLIVLAVVGFFVFTVVLAVVMGARQLRRAEANLRILGQRLDLPCHSAPRRLGFRQIPEVRGQLRGKQVRVYAYTTGSGKSRTHWAAVMVTPPQNPTLVLQLAPQGWGVKLLTLFGAREIQLGDAAFDRAWFIQTGSPDFVRAALLPELRHKLEALRSMGATGTYEVIDGGVRYAERGWFTDRKRIERFEGIVDAACDLADIVEVHAAQPSE